MAETATVVATIAAAISALAAGITYWYSRQINRGSISIKHKSSQVERTEFDKQEVVVKFEFTNFGKEPVFLKKFEFLVFDLNLQEHKIDTQKPLIDWLHEGQSFPYTNRFEIKNISHRGEFSDQAIIMRISFKRRTTLKTEITKIYLINRGTDPDMPYMTKNMYEKVRPKIPPRFWRERQ